MVKVRNITLSGSMYLAMSIATSLATLTSKSKLSFKSVEIKLVGIVVIFVGLMEVSTPKTEGKMHHAPNLCIMRFAHDAVFPPFLEWIPPSIQKYYNDSLIPVDFT